jgi:hypothetical protein
MKQKIYIVIERIAYGGDYIKGIYINKGQAIQRRDNLAKAYDEYLAFTFYVVEWQDGATAGRKI